MKTTQITSQNGIVLKQLQAGLKTSMLAGVLMAAFGFTTFAGSPRLASMVSPALGAPAGGGGDSLSPIVSANGRYVLFASAANNLVLNSNNNPILPGFPPKLNVYLRDRTNGTTTLVSVNSAGTDGDNGDSFPVAISTNGQYVLFESSAANLVPGATTNFNNIYVRDLVNGTNILVSVNTNGICGNGVSRSSAMTPDGRYVAFVSAASDLVSGDTNGIADVFVRDLQAGTTTLASPGAQRLAQSLASSELPDITPDGRYVAFYSTSINLVSGVNSTGEVYVRDMVSGSTVCASSYAHTATLQQYNTTNSLSLNHTISDDGQFIAYEAVSASSSGSGGIILRYSQATGNTDVVATNATGILAGTELNHRQLDMTPDGRFIAYLANVGSQTAIYQWDAVSNTNTLVSGTYNGNTVPQSSICDWPVMDSTGRYVVFTALAINLTTNAVGGFHLYQRDMQAGVTRMVDVNSNGVASPGFSGFARMSTDGSLIAFESPDSALVPGDNNRAIDVMLANLSANTIELVSSAHADLPSLTPNGPSTLSVASVSANARYIAFSSEANNLVPNDTNGFRDVFVRDLLTGSNILVSADTTGLLPGNGLSMDSSISSDGRYVAFTSFASNLVAGDTNVCRDVFVRDLQLGQTTLVSVNSSGTGPGDADSYSPVISANGRYVLFHSRANNLAGSFPNTNYENLYWRDLQAGITRAFTNNASVGYGAGAMSPDGQYVVVANQTVNSSTPIYIWNAQLGTPVYTNNTTYARAVAISPDGTRIGFIAGSSAVVYAADRMAHTTVNLGSINLVHGGFSFSGDSRFMAYVAIPVSPSLTQVYSYDFVSSTNLRLSQSTNGVAGNTNSDSPVFSSDGRFVAYRSSASNLGAGTTNGIPNIFLYDTQAGTTTLVSGSATSSGRSLTPVFSGDAQTLVFESWDSGFAAQDFNQWSDIFALSLYSTNAQPAFSAGILPAAVNGQAPVITWPITSGKNYQVQYKNQLSDPVWRVLNGSVTINGSQESMVDPSPSSSQRFYRIVAY